MNYDRAVSAYEMALSLESNAERYFVEILIESLSKAYLHVHREQDAVNVLLKYADKFKTAKYTYALAGAYYENHQTLQALMAFIKATSMKDRDTLGESLFVCYNNIIAIYREMGENEMADMYMDLYEKSRQERDRVLNS